MPRHVIMLGPLVILIVAEGILARAIYEGHLCFIDYSIRILVSGLLIPYRNERKYFILERVTRLCIPYHRLVLWRHCFSDPPP